MDGKVATPTLNNPIVASGEAIPFYPIGDRVVVERIAGEEDVVGGGIIVPGVDKDTSLYARVIAAGPLAMDVLTDAGIEVGDTICIGKWSGVQWPWRPKGSSRTERVDVINVKDIYGCQQLASKIMSGKVGIEKRKELDGPSRYRFCIEDDEEQKGAA